MATAGTQGNILDSIWARLVALILAVLIALLIYRNWHTDIATLLSGETSTQSNLLAGPAARGEPAKQANPELAACLKQRVGDVDKMKSDGVIDDSQYALFRRRAEDLCAATHSR